MVERSPLFPKIGLIGCDPNSSPESLGGRETAQTVGQKPVVSFFPVGFDRVKSFPLRLWTSGTVVTKVYPTLRN